MTLEAAVCFLLFSMLALANAIQVPIGWFSAQAVHRLSRHVTGRP